MTSRKSTPDATDAAWSSEERELLRAARGERMPAHLEARMRESLDFQATGASAGPSAPSAGTWARAGQLFGAKLSLWGVLSLIVIGSFAYRGLRGSTPAQPESKREALTLLAAEADRVAPQVEPALAAAADPGVAPPALAAFAPPVAAAERGRAGALDPNATPRPAVDQARASITAARSRTADSATAKERPADPASGVAAHGFRRNPASDVPVRNAPVPEELSSLEVDALRLEAELLDAARTALSRDALYEARQLLGRYSARFARGILRPESDVLGIELEMRSGQTHVARSHATRFLTDNPNHPLRERVRELAKQ